MAGEEPLEVPERKEAAVRGAVGGRHSASRAGEHKKSGRSVSAEAAAGKLRGAREQGSRIAVVDVAERTENSLANDKISAKARNRDLSPDLLDRLLDPSSSKP